MGGYSNTEALCGLVVGGVEMASERLVSTVNSWYLSDVVKAVFFFAGCVLVSVGTARGATITTMYLITHPKMCLLVFRFATPPI